MVGVKPVLCHNQNTVKQETKYKHTIELWSESLRKALFQSYQNEGKTTYQYHTAKPQQTTRKQTRKQKTKSQELSHQEEATRNRVWKQYPVPENPK